MLILNPISKVTTIDCYGTLVKWHRAMRVAARTVLAHHIGADVPESQAISLADGIRAAAIAP